MAESGPTTLTAAAACALHGFVGSRSPTNDGSTGYRLAIISEEHSAAISTDRSTALRRRRAAQLDPKDPDIQNSLGVTLSQKGMRLASQTAFRRAIQLNPEYADAHRNLAISYLSQTPPLVELARYHYDKAVAAGSPTGFWRMSGHPAVQQALRNAYFDSMGLPRVAASEKA